MIGIVLIALASAQGNLFKRGDANNDGVVNVADPIALLGYLFLGGAAPSCLDAADANDDGVLNIEDPIGMLNYLFLGGEKPKPFFEVKGKDPTPDGLTCGLGIKGKDVLDNVGGFGAFITGTEITTATGTEPAFCGGVKISPSDIGKMCCWGDIRESCDLLVYSEQEVREATGLFSSGLLACFKENCNPDDTEFLLVNDARNPMLSEKDTLVWESGDGIKEIRLGYLSGTIHPTEVGRKSRRVSPLGISAMYPSIGKIDGNEIVAFELHHASPTGTDFEIVGCYPELCEKNQYVTLAFGDIVSDGAQAALPKIVDEKNPKLVFQINNPDDEQEVIIKICDLAQNPLRCSNERPLGAGYSLPGLANCKSGKCVYAAKDDPFHPGGMDVIIKDVVTGDTQRVSTILRDLGLSIEEGFSLGQTPKLFTNVEGPTNTEIPYVVFKDISFGNTKTWIVRLGLEEGNKKAYVIEYPGGHQSRNNNFILYIDESGKNLLYDKVLMTEELDWEGYTSSSGKIYPDVPVNKLAICDFSEIGCMGTDASGECSNEQVQGGCKIKKLAI